MFFKSSSKTCIGQFNFNVSLLDPRESLKGDIWGNIEKYSIVYGIKNITQRKAPM